MWAHHCNKLLKTEELNWRKIFTLRNVDTLLISLFAVTSQINFTNRTTQWKSLKTLSNFIIPKCFKPQNDSTETNWLPVSRYTSIISHVTPKEQTNRHINFKFWSFHAPSCSDLLQAPLVLCRVWGFKSPNGKRLNDKFMIQNIFLMDKQNDDIASPYDANQTPKLSSNIFEVFQFSLFNVAWQDFHKFQSWESPRNIPTISCAIQLAFHRKQF